MDTKTPAPKPSLGWDVPRIPLTITVFMQGAQHRFQFVQAYERNKAIMAILHKSEEWRMDRQFASETDIMWRPDRVDAYYVS